MKKTLFTIIFFAGIILLGSPGTARAEYQLKTFEVQPKTNYVNVFGVIVFDFFGVSGAQTSDFLMRYTIAQDQAFTQAKKTEDGPITLEQETLRGAVIGKISFTKPLTQLSPNTTYYVQVSLLFKGVEVFKTDIKNIQTKSGNDLNDIDPTISESVSKRGYKLLAPIDNFPTAIPSPEQCKTDPTIQFCNIGDFINLLIELAIAIAAVMLVIKLVINGYVYMVSDTPFKMNNAKQNIMDSIIGILLALTAYMLLNTINPQLVNNSITLEEAVLETGGDTNDPTDFSGIDGYIGTVGISCPKSGLQSSISSIAASYQGKVTYQMGAKKGSPAGSGTVAYDCSGWVNTVLRCAGYEPGRDFINSGTSGIFSGAEKVTSIKVTGNVGYVNNKALNPGDLIGWPDPDGNGFSGKSGHVLIYVGNGEIMDSHGPKGKIGQAIGRRKLDTYPFSKYSSDIRIKRIPR